MSKIYFIIAEAPVRFIVKEGGVESFKDVHIGDEIIVNGEEISFPNSNATTETKFSEVEKYFKRYRTQEEHKEMKEFKKQAAIAAMQALIQSRSVANTCIETKLIQDVIQSQDKEVELTTTLAIQYAESLTNNMFD